MSRDKEQFLALDGLVQWTSSRAARTHRSPRNFPAEI